MSSDDDTCYPEVLVPESLMGEQADSQGEDSQELSLSTIVPESPAGEAAAAPPPVHQPNSVN